MINRFLFAFIVFVSQSVTSQNEQMLFGKVVSGDAGVANTFVINKSKGTEVKTNLYGDFSSTASPGDVLIIYNIKINSREFKLTEDSFKTQPFIITVSYHAYELDELVIEEKISSETLGIVPKGQKQNTPRERRLFTAGDFKPIHLLGLLGGSLNVDALINKINGRTNKLKKEIALEQKTSFMDKINNIYTEEDIVTEFKIPKEHVQGFVFYVAEDAEFTAAMKAKNDTMAKFLMTGLAVKYLKLITNE